MATATQTKPLLQAIRHKNPLPLWHLLSLDAPTVAALWTWFIARANHIQLPLSSTLSMALAVWMLYAADRLMDARLLNASPTRHEDLEARHYFHHRHRRAFRIAILFAFIALAILLPHLPAEAIRLYLILGVLVAAYFLLIHASHSPTAQQKVAHRLPKEIAVGLFFAAATFIPTVARRPDLRTSLLPSAILFATLCSVNCLFIYAWEHSNDRQRAHAITRIALRSLSLLSILLTLSSIALSLIHHRTSWPIPCATAISVPVLLLLHNRRQSISRTTLRAAADLALTTPILLLPFLHR